MICPLGTSAACLLAPSTSDIGKFLAEMIISNKLEVLVVSRLPGSRAGLAVKQMLSNFNYVLCMLLLGMISRGPIMSPDCMTSFAVLFHQSMAIVKGPEVASE